MEAVLAQQPIQVGIRLKGSNYTNVLFGVVKMSAAERDQVAACLGEWAEGQADLTMSSKR
ncbi:hypothetical protein AZKH_1702 [Azoarcus sp. KH32C]|nr:hypothetical protein AZKH_1702 [Azoarcus sp. KH32C]